MPSWIEKSPKTREAVRLLRTSWKLEQMAQEHRQAALASLPPALRAEVERVMSIAEIRSDVLADYICQRPEPKEKI